MSQASSNEAAGLEEAMETWKDAGSAKKSMNRTARYASAEESMETKSESGEDEGDRMGGGASYELPQNLQSFASIASRNKLSDIVKQAPEASQILAPRRCDNFPPFTIVEGDSGNAMDRKECDEWTMTNPYTAHVRGGRWLTAHDNDVAESTDVGAAWGESKRVIEMEVSIGESGIRYEPGDSVGICTPNPEYAVDIILRRLQEVHADIDLQLSTVMKGLDVTNSMYGGKQSISLFELLTYRLDIMCIPKKATIAALAKFCEGEEDKAAMQWLSSKGAQGKLLYSKFIEAQKLGTAELLLLFPTCKPPLQMLCAHLSTSPPRYYSIACSPLTHPKSLTVAFSVVRYGCIVPASEDAESVVIKRSGVCTTYLENILSPWLNAPPSSVVSSPVCIRIFHKATLTFRLPGSIAHPLIMVGPGTGIAPFVGFLQHRAKNTEEPCSEAKDVSCGFWRGFEVEEEHVTCCAEGNAVGEYIRGIQPGKVHLFFGCRNEKDYLYRDALECFTRSGTITDLHVAMSRVDTQKVYVQDRLRACGADIVRLLLDEGAYFYICGDGNRMAKDVTAAVMDLLVEHGHMDTENAEEFIEDLKQRRRFVLDIWS